MSLLDIFADLSGLIDVLRDTNTVLGRIASAFERLSPPLAVVPDIDPAIRPADDSFHLAESPEEYEVRTSHEADLAVSLGVAPWSPAFQVAIDEMRQELLQPKIEVDDEGNETRTARSAAEADDIIRQAFQLAKSEANIRSEGRSPGRA